MLEVISHVVRGPNVRAATLPTLAGGAWGGRDGPRGLPRRRKRGDLPTRVPARVLSSGRGVPPRRMADPGLRAAGVPRARQKSLKEQPLILGYPACRAQ